MARNPNGDALGTVLIFENEQKARRAYLELFRSEGYRAEAALPSDDVRALCERLAPDVVVFDMGFWEADTANVFGILNEAIGFDRPIIIALTVLPHQVRRAKRFGADGIWIRGVDDAASLPRLAADLLQRRREGKLAQRVPRTPL